MQHSTTRPCGNQLENFSGISALDDRQGHFHPGRQPSFGLLALGDVGRVVQDDGGLGGERLGDGNVLLGIRLRSFDPRQANRPNVPAAGLERHDDRRP